MNIENKLYKKFVQTMNSEFGKSLDENVVLHKLESSRPPKYEPKVSKAKEEKKKP